MRWVTAAHLFQLLMPLEVPVIAVFAATQLERRRRWALRFLAVQTVLWLALVATVFVLGL